MILFIPVVHEGDFGFVGWPWRYRLLLHGLRGLGAGHLRLSLLHVAQLLRLLRFAGVHGLGAGSAHLLPVDIVDVLCVGSHSFTRLVALFTLS